MRSLAWPSNWACRWARPCCSSPASAISNPGRPWSSRIPTAAATTTTSWPRCAAKHDWHHTMTRIKGHILTAQGFVAGTLEFGGDGHIARISGTAVTPQVARESAQPLVLPGFIDLHVHGGGGHDIMEGGEAALRVAELHASHGMTSLLATTMEATMVCP